MQSESAKYIPPTRMQHIALCMRKNWWLKKRKPCGTCCEMFLPLFMLLLLVLGWAAATNNNNVIQEYWHVEGSPPKPAVSDLDTIWLQNPMACCYNGTSLTFYPNMTRCVPLPNGTIPYLFPLPGTDVFANFPLMLDFMNPAAVPTMDAFLLLRALLNELQVFGKNADKQKPLALVITGGPEAATFREYLAAKFGSFRLTQYVDPDTKQPVNFPTEEDAAECSKTDRCANKFWAVVNFDTFDRATNNFAYTIRCNVSDVPPTSSTTDFFVSGGLGSKKFQQYMSSGFLVLQRTIDDYLINVVSKNGETKKIATVIFPTAAYTDYVFLSRAGGLIPTVIVFAYLYFVSMLVKSVVEEKELRIREGMLIMGLDKTSLYVSWFLTYAIMSLCSSFIISLLIASTFFNHSSFLLIFVFVFMFSMSLVGFSFLISTFFSKAKTAATVSPLLLVGSSIPIALLPSGTADSLVLLMCYPFSTNTFQLVFKLLTNYETAGTGASWADWSADDISFSNLFVVLIVNNLLYFALAMYLDNVLPSEFGVPLHPLFFLQASYWRDSQANKKPETKELDDAGSFRSRGTSVIDPGSFRNLAEGSLCEDLAADVTPSVRIRSLRKTFPSSDGGAPMVAVDSLDLSFFEGQITVMLGHNGAGKTTTINMLTGMFPPTSGDCTIYGRSIRKEMPIIRRDLGFCPQHNILWKGVTCMEHLIFFAGLKGVPASHMESTVIAMLESVDLMEKKDAFANVLSGGQKRKLSVAIALIGGSKLVFLDEPTAGMDVQARHHMWELLRSATHGRTVVLTTHYMDEADLLGNSIAILHKGKLNCWGSPMFLKNKLGVGYNLALAVTAKADMQKIQTLVTERIEGSRNVSKAAGEVQFCLPMATIASFPLLFEELETKGHDAGVTSFGISVTTMEEVFLRIAMQEAETKHSDAEADPMQKPSMLTYGSTTHVQLEDPIVNTAGDEAYSVSDVDRVVGSALILRQIRGLFMKRVHVARRDRKAQCCNLVLPVVIIALAMLVKGLHPPAQPSFVFTPTMYPTAEGPVVLPVVNCDPAMKFDPHYTIQTWNYTSVNATNEQLVSTADHHGGTQRWSAIECNVDVAPGFNFLWHNATSWHALPEVVHAFDTAFLTNVTIQMASHPLPFTDRQENVISNVQSLLISLFVLIPFCLLPSNYVTFLVKEREVKSKHVQLVSGVNLFAYWGSNFAFDILTFIVTESLALITFAIFNRTEYVGDAETTMATATLLFFFGLSSTSLVYATNYAFVNHSTAQNVTMMGGIITGFFLVIAGFILDLIDSTKDINKTLKYFYRVVPSYCLGEGIMNMATRPLLKMIGQSKGAWDMDVTGTLLIYMAVETPVLLLITLVIDAPWWQSIRSKMDPQGITAPNQGVEDSDVTQERKAVEQGSGREDDLVTVQRMRKVFPPAGNLNTNKIAVQDISFGVKKEEIFGFLGTNGAGKTTTMSILSGEFPPTSGVGFIHGHNVVTDLGRAQQHLGFCPQFDALLDLMTPEEHMQLFARLRGIPENRIDHCTRTLFQKLDLLPHARKLSMDLSGGNKRKLSIAIAMVGGPPVLFLDEPSAGMDPVARRGLWNALQEFSHGRSVVLTTHHLEEVEALCHRVAIMVDGTLRCLGSLQHLKDKFGTGYDLDVKAVDDRHTDKCTELVMSIAPHAILEEVQGTRLSFKLPKEGVKLSVVFAQMQKAVENKDIGVRDFALSQTSLESVFMRLSQKNLQQEVENVASAMRLKEDETHK